VTLASLDRTILFAYRLHLETSPQQPRGAIPRRRGGLMSRHTDDEDLDDDGDDEDLSWRTPEDLRFSAQVDRNTQGIELEKSGRTSEAVALYEESIAEGFTGTHPYSRLIVLYHRVGRIENEIRVTERAIEVFRTERMSRGEPEAPGRGEAYWVERLGTTQELKAQLDEAD